MASRTLIALLALTVSCAVAQQYGGNYVDGGDFDYQDQGSHALPAPRPAPAPIQRSIRPNPPQQSLRPSGPTTPRAPPVAILKQINRHNDDGSYTYGFEGADGSFKIETKLVTGEVMGKYGYVDDTGKVRTVEYGANKYGFQPVGEGITVAPPTYVDESRLAKGDQGPDYDDGQYYPELPSGPASAGLSRPRAQPQPQPQRPRVAPRPKAPQQQQYFDHSFQQPQPQPQGQVIYQQQQQHQQQHHSQTPVPRVSQAFGPEPSRAQIAGAAPAPTNEVLYRPQPPAQRQYASPAPPPHRNQAHFTSALPQQRAYPQQPAPVHQFEHHAPQQQQQQFQQAPRPLPQARQAGVASFFDQLTKDYALPTGGHSTATHDITFGVNY